MHGQQLHDSQYSKLLFLQRYGMLKVKRLVNQTI